MFNYLKKAEATDSQEEKLEYKYLAKKKDLAQVRIKVIVNSEYGVSGLSSSWFFNRQVAWVRYTMLHDVAFLNMDEC